MNLEKKVAYAIMPVGKMKRNIHATQQKTPEVALQGLFLPFFWWLNPKAGYQLLLSIQPFADIVAGYTSRNEIIILKKVIRGLMFLHQAALLIENIGLVQI